MEFVFVFIVIFAVIAILRRKSKRKTNRAWKTIGYHLGLRYFDSPKPSLTGVYHNRSVRINLYTEEHGSSSQMYTRFEVEYKKPIQTLFQLGRQGYLFEMAGTRDIEVGFPDFDKAVLVKANSEDEVREFFQSDRARNACLNVINKSGFTKVKITNHKIIVTVIGLLVNVEDATSVLKQLIHAASILETEATNPPKKEMQKLAPPPLPGRKKKPVVPEEWYGDPGIVAEPIVPVIHKPEANTEQQKLTELSPPTTPEEYQPTPKLEPEIVTTEPLPPTAPDSISISDIAGELFEAKLGKYEAGKRFDVLFKGEEVHWTCALSSIEPGSSDRVFGRDSGWIAIFDLGSFAEMESGSGPLLVKYRTGSDEVAEFKSREGAEFDIVGELIKYDPFTTTLYIDSGDPEEKESSTAPTRFVSYAERMKKEMHSRPGEVRRFS